MDQTEVKKGPTKVRKVGIRMPQGFYDLLERVSNVWDESVDDYIIKSLVMQLGMDIETNLGVCIGEKTDDGCVISIDREDIEALARPDEEEKEEVQI